MASCSCAATLLCCKYLFLSRRDFHYFYNRFKTNTKIKNQFKTKNYTTFTTVKILNHIQMLKSVIQHLNISQKQIAKKRITKIAFKSKCVSNKSVLIFVPYHFNFIFEKLLYNISHTIRKLIIVIVNSSHTSLQYILKL